MAAFVVRCTTYAASAGCGSRSRAAASGLLAAGCIHGHCVLFVRYRSNNGTRILVWYACKAAFDQGRGLHSRVWLGARRQQGSK